MAAVAQLSTEEPCASAGTGPIDALTQTMSGVITGCVRIGNVVPGHYTVSIDQVLDAPFTPPPPPPFPRVAISLIPPAGPPGTTVTVHGTHAQAPSEKSGEAQHVTLCWAGCDYGVQYAGVPVLWTSATTFTTELSVPGGAWIERHPDRALAPRDGFYRIEVACLDGAPGCSWSAEASTDYRITGPTGFAHRCDTTASCGSLSLSPKAGVPATTVRLSGDLPIESVIGADKPFVFQTEVTPGYSPTAPEVSFSPIDRSNPGGARNVELGNAELTVLPAPRFSSLGILHPIGETADGLSPTGENPVNGSRIGLCDGSTITISSEQSLEDIPTADVTTVLDRLGLGLPATQPPQCLTVALPGDSSSTVFAGFSVNPHAEAPPFVDAALYTEDFGQVWKVVPLPAGASLSSFGGFRYRGDKVEALFFPKSGELSDSAQGTPRSTGVEPPLVEETSNGGASWQQARFACPPDGPCLTFGAYSLGNCAMNGTIQLLLTSSSAGRTWQVPDWPSDVEACNAAQIIRLSTRDALLLDSGSDYPLLQTTDAGRSWFDVALPPLGSASTGALESSGPDHLLGLPDGGVLATGEGETGQSWELLSPGAKSWCTVTSVPARLRADSGFATFELLGDQIYWTAQVGLGSGSSSGMTAFHIPASSLSCTTRR